MRSHDATPLGRAAGLLPAAWLLVSGAGVICRVAAAADDAVWHYGWTHGVEKVSRNRPERPFHSQPGAALRVELAANEYEGVQLVLRSGRPLRNVRVRVSNLTSRDGHSLASKFVEVLPVGYVNTKKPSYHGAYVGWWPDPLLNFLDSFNVEPDVWQPVWLDVHAPAGQPEGVYKGTVTVTADQVPPLAAPLEVTVWPLALPAEHHFPVAMAFNEEKLRPVYSRSGAEWEKYLAYCRDEADLADIGSGEARRLVDIRRRFHEMTLAHHFSPDSIYRVNPPRADEIRRWYDQGVRWFNLMHAWTVGPHAWKPGQPYPPDRKEMILRRLDESIRKFQAAGLLDKVHPYVYGFDEIRAGGSGQLIDMFAAIRKRHPNIPLMTTPCFEGFDVGDNWCRTYAVGLGMDKFVDIWVPKLRDYANMPAAVAEARQRGNSVWWYVVGARFFIEDPAASLRLLMGFMPHKCRSQGFLYWCINTWTSYTRVRNEAGKMVWKRTLYTQPLDRGPLTNFGGNSYAYSNGPGRLMYPGPDGPVPTLRLKYIRDGLEDYEYLWLLKQAVAVVRAGKRRASEDWLARAGAALAVDASVVETSSKYTKDGAVVLAARREIARLLTEVPPVLTDRDPQNP